MEIINLSLHYPPKSPKFTLVSRMLSIIAARREFDNGSTIMLCCSAASSAGLVPMVLLEALLFSLHPSIHCGCAIVPSLFNRLSHETTSAFARIILRNSKRVQEHLENMSAEVEKSEAPKMGERKSSRFTAGSVRDLALVSHSTRGVHRYGVTALPGDQIAPPRLLTGNLTNRDDEFFL